MPSKLALWQIKARIAYMGMRCAVRDYLRFVAVSGFVMLNAVGWTYFWCRVFGVIE